MEKCDILIIGAGPSGSVVAYKLLKNGFNIIVLEKVDFIGLYLG